MALTLVNVKGQRAVSGSRVSEFWTVAGDTSYPIGGYSVTPRQLGLNTVFAVDVVQPRHGYGFRYNIATQKLLVEQQAPYLVDELTGTIAGASYTLKYLPGYIVSVRGTAGSTGVKKPIPQAGTNAAGLVRINWATGVLTFGDAGITAARIVYVPLGLPGFQTPQLIIDESVALSGGVFTLANLPLAISYMYDTAAPLIVTPVKTGDTPASGQASIVMSTGVITAHAGVAGPLLVTYLKAANSPLTLLNQTSRNIASNQIVLAGAQIYLPALGAYIPTTNSGTPVAETLVDRGGTAAANAPTWDQWANTFTFSGTLSSAEIPLVGIDLGLHGDRMLEVPNATDLSWVTGVLLEAVGY